MTSIICLLKLVHLNNLLFDEWVNHVLNDLLFDEWVDHVNVKEALKLAKTG